MHHQLRLPMLQRPTLDSCLPNSSPFSCGGGLILPNLISRSSAGRFMVLALPPPGLLLVVVNQRISVIIIIIIISWDYREYRPYPPREPWAGRAACGACARPSRALAPALWRPPRPGGDPRMVGLLLRTLNRKP